MYTLGIPYGYDNPTASGFLGAGELRNDSMVYSDNLPSCKLRGDKGVRVEANLQLL